ncbi:MAG: DNA-directed RNA polymerase subunit beta [Candidatus Wallbacteria bacterium]|nr:DNA-directed RNA polymerase subunit beta [Candidatus Wallbacteria bacterium]
MPRIISVGNRQKISYQKLIQKLDVPNLIEVQLSSYYWFLQPDRESGERRRQGLHEVFQEIFPIQDFSGNLVLDYVEYNLGLPRCKKCPGSKKNPEEGCKYFKCYYREKKCKIISLYGKPYRIKYLPEDCRKLDQTYSIPLNLKVKLINKNTGEVKEQDVFLCNLPLMTQSGTFVFNGAERVVVNQLHRSPGVYFGYDRVKKIYDARIIPDRGAWIEIELDLIKDAIYVRLDRKRKVSVTALIRSLGCIAEEDILNLFNSNPYIKNTLINDKATNYEEALKEIYSRQRPGEPFTVENAENHMKQLLFNPRRYDLSDVGRYKINSKLRLRSQIVRHMAAQSVINNVTSELIVESGEIINTRTAELIEQFAGDFIKIFNNEGEAFLVYNEKDYEELRIKDVLQLVESVKVGKRTVPPGTTLTAELVEELTALEDARFIIRRNSEGEPKRVDTKELNRKFNEVELFNLENEDLNRKRVLGRIVHNEIRKDDRIIARVGDEINFSIWAAIKNLDIQKIIVKKGRLITFEDIIGAIRYLLEYANGIGNEDDIDHLGNRRVRRVGEQLQNHFRMALMKMEREIKERMTIQDPSGITPQALINSKPITSMVNDFFGLSQLSQFMDQTNALSELTHKRRVSALGPGGVKRERAGYEVRDVHPTHYGRICPIETPEGPNAGLISSLAVYSRINELGFIETPYTEVDNLKVSDKIHYFDASREDECIIGPPDLKVDNNSKLVDERVPAKFLSEIEHEFSVKDASEIDFVGVSPMQMVSVAASLIPFLEHDDSNRALMGTNMQRQAVPLLRSTCPYVGTGMEFRTARDSGSCVISDIDGEVMFVDAGKIGVLNYETVDKYNLVKDINDLRNCEGVFLAEDIAKGKKVVASKGEELTPALLKNLQKQGIKDIGLSEIKYFPLAKFLRSNQGTCINQKVIVKRGDQVKKGDVLADGSACDKGELALGKDILVAFMPWEGYNFEDAFLLSERLVKDEVYTSLHIEEYEVEARDTKLGPEEITRDIPNVSNELLRNLDENGIIRVGAEVGPGDILVGKVTPKGEMELTAEDKLLRAIFGEKAKEVRNTSYSVPHGEGGKVVEVMNLSRESKDDLPHDVNRLVRVFIAQKRRITEGDKMSGRHGNKGVISRILPEGDMPCLANGAPVDIVLNPLGVPSRMNVGQVLETYLGMVAAAFGREIETPIFNGCKEWEIIDNFVRANLMLFGETRIYGRELGLPVYWLRIPEEINLRTDKKLMDNGIGWDLPEFIGYLAETYGIFLCGLDDRRPIAKVKPDSKAIAKAYADNDWSQIIEFGKYSPKKEKLVKTYSNAKKHYREGFKPLELSKEEQKILLNALRNVDLTEGKTGKRILLDGRSGQPFDNEVLVGYTYILKLAHLVEDKIHARSTGPYSLVTQQPLGGKAQFGGQRFGEMEVWALEAYGAAHVLQEMLTVKSDDVEGRVSVYEAIIKGENVIEPNVPESFKVLVSELRSMGLKMETIKLAKDNS